MSLIILKILKKLETKIGNGIVTKWTLNNLKH